MKLRKKEETLSNSLLNNSQIKEDENSIKTDTAKSQMIIRALKTPNIFNKKAFVESIHKKKEIIKIPNLKSKQKSKRIHVNKGSIDIANSSGEMYDLIVPKKNVKKVTSSGRDQTTSRLSPTKSYSNPSVSTSSQRTSLGKQSTDMSDNASLLSSFKTPTMPRANKQTVNSPICASSPISDNKNGKRNSPNSYTTDDLFSSAIISSSEEFRSGRSSRSSINPSFSPIKNSPLSNIKNGAPRVGNKPVAKSVELKKKLVKKAATRKTYAYTSEAIVRTRSGRESRPVSQTELGKFVQEFYHKFYHKY